MSASLNSPERPVLTGNYRYKIYGLVVRSDFPLPELTELGDDAQFDVHIRTGSVPVVKSDELTVVLDGAILSVPDIASYYVRFGREIIVDAQPGVPDRNIRLYLLGSVLGIVVHQRGMLPLHANAIEIDCGAIAFMAESGGGKSTLAASLHDAGYRVIADDVCVLRLGPQSTRAQVQPGLPRIRLWRDALERTGREPRNYEYSYAGDETYEKFDVPIPPERSAVAEVSLIAIYVLSASGDFEVRRLRGAEAVDAIFSHTYRGLFVPQLGLSQAHFRACLDLASVTPVFLLKRPRILGDLSGDIQKIVSHAKQIGTD